MQHRFANITALAGVAVLTALCGVAACTPSGGGTVPIPTKDGIQWGNDNGTINDGGNEQDTNGTDSKGGDTPDSITVDVLPTNIPCAADQNCPAQLPYCGDDDFCKQCLSNNDCTEGTCESGFCLSENCTPDETRCEGPSTQLICNASGTGWVTSNCSSGFCAAGLCTQCEPSAIVCQGFKVVECAADGQTSTEIEDCQGQGICVQGNCQDCAPGQPRCNGDVVEVCNQAGSFEFDTDCAAAGSECKLGKCLDPCEGATKDSNAGCDYWAVNLDNIDSVVNASNYTYAVVVANTQATPVTVRVLQKTSTAGPELEIRNLVVPGGGLQVIDLPKNVAGTAGIFNNVYRVRSTGPIIATQFNPLENVETYSNDASLLLPSNTFGTEYIVSSRQQVNSSEGVPWRGFITVVASQDDTVVSVTPTVPLLAGSGVAAVDGGGTAQFTLQQYEVLNLKSNLSNGDLTGSIVTSDKPIGVYSGHDAISTSTQCCADHLEHQLFPVETWGTEYVAGKSFTRGIESDYWRIIASENGTTVNFTPSSVHATQTLQKGQYYEFATTSDFVVTADKPISVVQTLASSQETTDGTDLFCMSNAECSGGAVCAGGLPPILPGTCSPIGDPAMIMAPPVSQWRSDYVFLAPPNYVVDYVNVSAPVSATVTLDGNVVPPGNFQTIPGTAYKVGRILVNDGVHTLTSSEPVGLSSYGYDIDVSYGYTAGLNLEAEE